MEKNTKNSRKYEYEIPEGYDVRIEGSKVIIELKESEDERIRKEIIDWMKGGSTYDWQDNKERWLAYLERQKEQKHIPIPKFKVGDRIYDKSDSYNRNVIREVGKDYYINAFAQKMDMAYTDANFDFLEHLDNGLIDSKPAEWSEEDEKMLEKCVGYMTKITPIPDKERLVRFETIKDEECINWLNNRLKSLRPQPHWKPSEEQMEALLNSFQIGINHKKEDELLNELYDALKKLL